MSETQRIVLEPVFVLHTRPYSNTSLIAELFSMRHGRVVVMAKSARGPKSRFRGMLQLFSPMLASWSGRYELKHLNHLELQGLPYQLSQEVLLCGFYLNELLMKLLRHDDPFQKLYRHYQDTLNALEQGAPLQPTLRYFEKHLLDELGYGLPLTKEALSGAAVQSDWYYRYLAGRGFVHCEQVPDESLHLFSGAALLALHQQTLVEPQHLLQAKRLMRMVIAEHLGGKPLQTRRLSHQCQ